MSLSDFAQGMWVGIAITLGVLVIGLVVLALRERGKPK